MKRLWTLVAVLAIAGCGGKNDSTGDDGGGDEVCGGAKTCSRSADCNRGDVCDLSGDVGCCTGFVGCTADSCPAGEFCDVDFTCQSAADKCAIEDCECHILNDGDQLEASGDPKLVFAPNSARQIRAVLAVTNGPVLPMADAGWTFTLSSSTSFSISAAGVVTANATATSAASLPTVTADAGNDVTCSASLVNLGPVAANSTRFYLFDEQTGEPVSGASVLVDVDSGAGTDGTPEQTLTSDANGIAVATALGGAATVTVFRANYNYLSVVALPATTTQVSLPLSPRAVPRTTGGFTGKMDWATYWNLRGDRQLSAAFTASSFEPLSFLNFDADRFFGRIPGDCSVVPTPAGCYSIDIPGLTRAGGMQAPLPGGVILGFGPTDIKAHFDSVGIPGRRFAWSIGTDLQLTDLGEALSIAAGFLTCSCDANPDACDNNCNCDLDCDPIRIDFGAVLDSILPILPEFAVGVAGNLPLVETPYSDWESYISTTYANRSADADYPRLDSTGGTYDSLSLRELLEVFTDYTVGDLPPDPAIAGKKMEAMAIITGVQAPGLGFVPLGFGAGLDCTGSDCLDAAGPAAPTDKDGLVNGSRVCLTGTGDENRCDDLAGLPAGGTLANGHMGVFHARASGGLESGEWLTVVAAAPLTTIADPALGIRASGYILRAQPPAGAQTLSGSFPGFPAMPANALSRTLATTAQADADIQWATVATPTDANGITVRWNVYFPKGTTAFHAPAVPGGFADPFEAPVADTSNVPADHINVTLVGMKVEGRTLAELIAAGDDDTLLDLTSHITAISLQSKNIRAR